MPVNIFHRLGGDGEEGKDIKFEQPVSRADFDKAFNIPDPAPCEVDEFFEAAKSAARWRVTCTVRLPDEKEPLSGELNFAPAAPGVPDSMLAALVQWREYGRAEAVEKAPWGGAYEPAGSIWIFRGSSDSPIRVWRYGSSSVDNPSPASCSGPDLYVQSPSLPFHVHLERSERI